MRQVIEGTAGLIGRAARHGRCHRGGRGRNARDDRGHRQLVRAAAAAHPTVTKQFFGSTVEPYTGKNTPVFRYTLTNCRGMQVKILSYGAIVQSITSRRAAAPRPTWCWASRRSRIT